MWAAASTLQAVFGVTYEIYSEARQLFLGAISKIGSRVDFRVCRDCVTRISGFPGCVTGQYLGGHVPPPSPSPPRDRILKCTKTEEFSSLNGKKGAEAGFRSRALSARSGGSRKALNESDAVYRGA